MAKITKEDLIAEAARLPFPEHVRAAHVALGELQQGLPVDQTCPVCHSLIRAWMPSPQNFEVWQTACDCGKCNSVAKGL